MKKKSVSSKPTVAAEETVTRKFWSGWSPDTRNGYTRFYPRPVKSVSSKTKRIQRKQFAPGRWITDHFANDPTAALTTADIGAGCYGVKWWDVSKSQRVATLRAMRTVSKANPTLQLMEGEGSVGQTTIYNSHNVLSYSLARLKTDYDGGYQYWREGVKYHMTEAKLRKTLRDERHLKLTSEGGAWWLFTQLDIAEQSGETARVAEINLMIDKMHAASDARLSAMGFGR